MDLQTFKTTLANAPATQLLLRLPTGDIVPPHFHVTEIGRVRKDFVDCGGVRRSTERCVLQTLIADDFEHRLSPIKLLGILEKSQSLGLSDHIAIDVEIQGQTIEIYEIAAASVDQHVLTFQLAATSTACLAPDRCGLPLYTLARKRPLSPFSR